jgi:large subunit ribosomal protein L17
MRHLKETTRLGRPADQRKALIRSLAAQVLWHGSIETTHARASVARRHVEELITLTRDGSLAARRRAAAFLATSAPPRGGGKWRAPAGRVLVRRLFDHIGPQYKDRKGGCTRIIRTGLRRGDGAEMAHLELVDYVQP